MAEEFKGNVKDTELKNVDPANHSQGEGDFVKNQLHSMKRVITHLDNAIGSEEDLPDWVQSEIAQAADKIIGVMNYSISSKEQDIEKHHGGSALMKEVKADPAGSWVVYSGGKVVKFKTHTGAKAYAEKSGGKVASSEFYADKVQKQGVAEGDNLTHAGQDVMVWTGPPTNNPPRDDKKYWIRGKLDSTEMHGGSMRANVMTAKGMYNPELSRVFNADMSEAYTPSPAKPFRNPPGFNKQGTGVGNKLAQQNRAELNQWRMGMSMAGEKEPTQSKGTPVPAKAFARGVLKDLKKVNVKDQGVAEGKWSNVIHTTDRSDEKAQREQEHKKQAGLATTVLKNHSQALDPKEIDLLTRYNLHHRGKPGVRFDRLDNEKAQQLIQNVLRFNQKGVAESSASGSEAYDRGYEDGVRGKDQQCPYKPATSDWQQYKDGWHDGRDEYELNEGQTDYQKRRQRERDVDAGRPVKPLPKNPQTDYARKRAQQKKEMELGEDSSTSSDAVERAVLNRIMVAHTDLLMQFGPEKVMQAAEEVAYNVGDVDEIGTSDVSAYVDQVRQILGA